MKERKVGYIFFAGLVGFLFPGPEIFGYGVGNFKTISEYDETFHEFLIALGSLARSYEKADLLDYAIRTYLPAIRYGTRQVADYEALARIYLRKDQPEKIQELLDMIKSSDFPHKDNLETALRNVIFSYR